MRRSLRVALVAGVLALAAVGAAAPASAVPAPVFSDDPFAGYGVFNSSNVHELAATWQQPSVNCLGAHNAVDFEVNIYSYVSSGPFLYAGVGTDANCASGSPKYSAWYEVTGPSSRIQWADPVEPGDLFRGTVDYLGANQYKFTIVNTTRGWQETGQLTGPEGPEGTQVGVERLDNYFPGFGSVPFTDVLQDGNPIGDDNPTATSADFGIATSPQVTPGSLSNNENFTPTFVHA